MIGAVAGWELRRMAASWPYRLLPFAVCGAAFLLTLVEADTLQLGGRVVTGPLNAWGAFWLVSTALNTLKIVFIAVAAQLVAQDLTGRTYALLMATRLPNWAYLGGRWLAGVALCAGLSLAILPGFVGAGGLLHLRQPAQVGVPNLPALALAWAVMAPIDVLLVPTLAFALGTLRPRAAGTVGVISIIVWLIVLQGLPDWLGHPYDRWIPAHSPLVLSLFYRYAGQYDALAATVRDPLQRVPLGQELANRLPDVTLWLPRLLWVGLSLPLLALTTARFNRFREETP